MQRENILDWIRLFLEDEACAVIRLANRPDIEYPDPITPPVATRSAPTLESYRHHPGSGRIPFQRSLPMGTALTRGVCPRREHGR